MAPIRKVLAGSAVSLLNCGRTPPMVTLAGSAGGPGRITGPGITQGAVTGRRGVTSVRLLGWSNGSA
jgi:hypothetical protein